MIKESMFVIAVPSLVASSNFYHDVLDFDIHEIGDPGWRMYVKDNCHIMAGECPDAIPPEKLGDHSYFAYLVVENANEYFDKIRSKDVEILKVIKDEPWAMREFSIKTIDGHRIMIGQRLGE